MEWKTYSKACFFVTLMLWPSFLLAMESKPDFNSMRKQINEIEQNPEHMVFRNIVSNHIAINSIPQPMANLNSPLNELEKERYLLYMEAYEKNILKPKDDEFKDLFSVYAEGEPDKLILRRWFDFDTAKKNLGDNKHWTISPSSIPDDSERGIDFLNVMITEGKQTFTIAYVLGYGYFIYDHLDLADKKLADWDIKSGTTKLGFPCLLDIINHLRSVVKDGADRYNYTRFNSGRTSLGTAQGFVTLSNTMSNTIVLRNVYLSPNFVEAFRVEHLKDLSCLLLCPINPLTEDYFTKLERARIDLYYETREIPKPEPKILADLFNKYITRGTGALTPPEKLVLRRWLDFDTVSSSKKMIGLKEANDLLRHEKIGSWIVRSSASSKDDMERGIYFRAFSHNNSDKYTHHIRVAHVFGYGFVNVADADLKKDLKEWSSLKEGEPCLFDYIESFKRVYLEEELSGYIKIDS